MIDKSKLFRIAHSILKRANVGSFSEALRLAWKAVKIYAGMLVGEVKFTFRKANGEIREAVGTLKNMVIDKLIAFNGAAMYYFDIEKKGFRSFSVANLI